MAWHLVLSPLELIEKLAPPYLPGLTCPHLCIHIQS
jgi:hypothetical protein